MGQIAKKLLYERTLAEKVSLITIFVDNFLTGLNINTLFSNTFLLFHGTIAYFLPYETHSCATFFNICKRGVGGRSMLYKQPTTIQLS